MVRWTASPTLVSIGFGLAVFSALSHTPWSKPVFAASSSTTALEVTSGGAAVTRVATGTPITLAATVDSIGTPVTPGTVTFCDVATVKACSGLAVIGTAQLTSAGKASIVVRLGPGSHSLEAVFAGTNTYASSESAPSELTVSGELTWGKTLTFVNSANPTISGLQPGAVVTGDFNNDGNLDMAVADATNNLVAVFLGKGDGTFQAGASYAVGQNPGRLAVADLNNDGKLDLVTLNYLGGTLSILLGKGDGSFQPAQAIQPASPYMSLNAITVADMNGDGNLDLVLATEAAPFDYVDILLGKGDGTFQAPKNSLINTPGLPLDPLSLVTGDFNGDGKLDVAVASWGYENTQTLAIMLGNGDGTLQTVGFPGGVSIIQPASSVAAGDFNGDGKLDLALTYYWSGYTAPGESSYVIFLGNGDGTFHDPIVSQLTTNTNPTSIQMADFNGDGILDLAMLGFGNVESGFVVGGKPMILLGNGDGTFQPPQSFPYGESALAVGDFNGDGIPDLAGPAVLLNTSASVVPSSFTASISPTSLTVNSGGQGTLTLSINPQHGFNSAVSFACSGLPSGAACSFNPATVTPSGAAATTTLTISVASRSSALLPGSHQFLPVTALALAVYIFGRRGRRSVQFWLHVALLCAGLGLLSGCGGRGGNGVTSKVTVTATSGTLQQTTTLSLTVN